MPFGSFSRFAVGLTAGALLMGCSSDPTLYSLAPVSGAAHSGGPAVVEVRTPVVSQSLDRDSIVRQDRNYKLKISHDDAWSEPLGSLIGRTLATDLSQRLPGTVVFAQNDAVASRPQAFVELTVTAFNENQNGEARLAGALSVHRAGEGTPVVLTVPVDLTTSFESHGTGHLVAALSRMLGALADQAAGQLLSLPPAPLPPT